MYKVFFNSRTIFLVDKKPDPGNSTEANTWIFSNAGELKLRILNWLKSDTKNDIHIWHQDNDELLKNFCSCFQNINASGGLVKNEKGEDLVIFRRGKWDLPKGKEEPGESPEETALREVAEECNLKGLKIRRFIMNTYHIYFICDIPVLKKTRWFEMTYEGKEAPNPQLKEEITKTMWLPYSNLASISGNTFKNVLEVIRAGQL
jgi:ADP-ribose pyrophosphatase YjhB (NUDIX family)